MALCRRAEVARARQTQLLPLAWRPGLTALHGRARLHADAVRLTSVGRCRRSVVLCPSEASERATHTRGNVREEEKHAAACAQRSLQSARRGRLCVFAGVRGIIGLAAARVILTQRIRQFFARRLRCHPFIMQSAFSKLALYFTVFRPFPRRCSCHASTELRARILPFPQARFGCLQRHRSFKPTLLCHRR